MNRKFTQAFTLIELLAVLVIILIIAGLFVGVSGPASQSAKKRKAEVMISALEVAIGMYKADTGLYPPSDNPSGAGTTAKLNDYLSTGGEYSTPQPVPCPPTGWSGPYMKFRSEDISPGYQIVDPWGTSYIYNSFSPTHNASSFDLWSCGPDEENDEGTAGTDPDDDIKNW